MAENDPAAAPAASEGEAASSLRDTMSEKYDEIMARDAAPEKAEPAAETETAAPATEEKPAVERARGPDGKFVAKSEDEPAAPTKTIPETPTAEPAKAATPEAAKPAPAEEATTPIPRTWQNDQRRQLFIKAPPEIRKALAEREAEMEAGVAKLQQRYGGIEQLVAPIRQQLAMEGRSPEQYLSALMTADHMLRTDPQQALGKIAQMYGVRMDGAQTQHTPTDPYAQEMQNLRNEVAQLKAAPQRAIDQDAWSKIEQFAADPANVFFPQVRTIMSSLLQNGVASTLKEAYDNAVQAHPEVRKQLDAEKATQAQAAQAEAAKKAAADAQRMATVNMATRGGAGSSAMPAASMRETMQKVADRIYGANA